MNKENMNEENLNADKSETELACIILKPGFRQFEKAVVARFSEYGKVTKRAVMILNDAILADHYPHLIPLIGEEGFRNVCDYMKSGPVTVLQFEGKKGCIKHLRKGTGATKDPEVGTIRYDFGIGDITRNVIHVSDSPEAGIIECNRMFRDAKKYGVKILSGEQERTC